MPEMDVAWQRIRDFMPVFQHEARSAGATSVRLFAQALWLATTGGRHGICYGVSCAWILARVGGTSAIDEAFLSAASGEARGDSHYQKVSGDLHNSQFSRHQSEKALRSLGQTHFLDAGLTLRETRNFDQKFYRMRSAAQFLAAHPGHHMVNTPNHALAASTTDTVCAFFDPNLGEAVFPSKSTFQTFFEKWMSQDRIVKAYRGKKGGRLDDLGEHKTLHLSIDHYS